MSTFSQLLNIPSVQTILLMELTAGVPLRAWTAYSAIYQHAIPAGVNLSAFIQDGSGVTLGTSLANVEATAGRWIQVGDVVYFNPSTGAPFTKVLIGMAAWYLSDQAKTLGSQTYDPRLKSFPKLSLRIESRFGGISQVGGGTVTIENTDGYFDGMRDLVRWDNGLAILKMGVDRPGAVMDYADYQTIGTWKTQSANTTDATLDITVVERKINIRNKLPAEVFTRDAYPYVKQDSVGKPIPTIYGLVPSCPVTLLDPNLNKFKACSHAVRGFIGLRKKESKVRAYTRTPDWFAFSTYYRTSFVESVTGVKFNGADVTKVDSAEAVEATMNSYTQVDNRVLLNPPSGVPSASNVTVAYEVSYDVWTEIDFASKDLVNGEFTVSSTDWDGDQDLCIDVIGKKNSDGTAMENCADIVADILSSVGESASFSTTRSYFNLGADRFGNNIVALKPSLYLSDLTEALEIINSINEICGTYLYVDSSGNWVFEASQPVPTSGLQSFDETSIVNTASIRRDEDATEVYTQVNVSYGMRKMEDWKQIEINASEPLRQYSGQPTHKIKEIDAAFWDIADAKYLSQRILSTQATPLVLYTLKVPRFGVLTLPGDKIILNRTRGDMAELCEVISVDADLAARQVTIIAGNMRSFGRSCGFWMGDSEPNWSASWTNQEARDHIGLSGFWCDDNAFADATDNRSFNVSRWW